MAKKFNYTGTCIPEKHFMANTSAKLARIMELVEDGEYFCINRPRQYGKSTTMFLLNKRLKEKSDFFPIKISFERIDSESYKSLPVFAGIFLNQLKRVVTLHNAREAAKFLEGQQTVDSFDRLSDIITELVTILNKKVVLLVDEVDKSSNNGLFLDFLAMLRDKYLLQREGEDKAFYSVILTGVHDVKTLKLKLRPDDERKYNSPWNIAVDFTIDLAFSAKEIESMLRDFAEERSVEMDIPHIAGLLHYYTAGYPFLVSKLCYIVDAYVKEETGSNEWTGVDIEAAVKHILRESNTNFDSLIKNLENNRDLYELVERIVLQGEMIPYVKSDPVISMGVTYGLLKSGTDRCTVHNRIYEQYIYNHMTARVVRDRSTRKVGDYNFQGNYILPGNKLNFKKIVLKFQEFMRQQYSEKDREFLERNGRLVFLAFLKPIINGQGFDFKEVQISEEKRLDVVVTFYQHRYVVELKKWYGPEAHERGLTQLSGYLDRQGVDEGFLIIYEFGTNKEWKQQEMKAGGKNVFAVWV